MNLIKILAIIFFVSPANAEMYKCKVDGKTSYQDTPCQAQGSIFKRNLDISVEQHKSAIAKLNKELAAFYEKKRLALDAANKERQIRAQEANAYANYQNAKQSERQANALEQRNVIERRKLNNTFRYRFYGKNFPIPTAHSFLYHDFF